MQKAKKEKASAATTSNVGIDLNVPIMNLQGLPVTHPDKTPATFKSIALEALLSPIDEDKTGKSAFRAFQLSQKIADGDILELSLDERTLIRNHVAAMRYNTLVVGRMFEILDGKNNAVLEE